MVVPSTGSVVGSAVIPPLELIGTGVLIVSPHPDAEFAIRDLNRRAADMLKLVRDAVDAPLHHALPAALAERLLDGLRRCRETGQVHELEAREGERGSKRWLRFVLAPQVDAEGTLEQVVATVSDVTGRKQAEAQSLSMELKFSGLVEGSIQGVLVVQHDRALFCNAACATLLGYDDPAQVLALPSISELAHLDDRERVVTEARSIARGTEPARRIQYRYLRPDGSVIWVEAFPSTVMWDNAPALQLTLNDITERILAETALQDSEERYRSLVESSVQGIIVHQDGKPVFANAAVARLLCYPDTESYLAAMRPGDFHHIAKADEARAMAAFQLLVSGKETEQRQDIELVRSDGSTAYAQVQGRRTTWQGRPAVVITLLDITQRHDAEAALQESEARYRMLVESSLQGIVVHVDNQTVFANDALAKLLGYPDAAAHFATQRTEAFRHVLPEDRDRVRSMYESLTSGKAVEMQMDIGLLRTDGRIANAQVQARRVIWEGKPAMLTVVVDITERRRAEAALQESEERYRTLVESLPLGTTVHVDGRGVFCNKFMARILGYDNPDEYVASCAVGDPLPHVPENRRAEALDIYLKLQAGDLEGDQDETTLIRRDGSELPVLVHARRIRWNGQPAVLTSLMDISQRKRLESELRDSHALLQSVFDALPVWVIVKDCDGRLLMANRLMLNEFGITADGLKGLTTATSPWMDEERRAYVSELDRRTVETGERIEVPDVTTVLPGGRTVKVRSIRVPLRDASGAITGLVLVGEDVTRIAEAREALAASEARYRGLVESSLEGIAVTKGGRTVLVNDTYARMLGYEDARMYLRANRNAEMPHLAPEFRAEALRRTQALEQGEESVYRWERPSVRLDQERRDLYVQSRRIEWDGAHAVLSTFFDVTEWRQAEQTLRVNEERYRTLVEGSVQGIVVYSLRDHRALMVNPALLKLLKTDSAEDYLRQSRLFWRVQEPFRRKMMVDVERMTSGEIDRFEGDAVNVRMDGSKRWLHYMACRIDWSDEPAVQVTLLDITDRKRAEEALKERQVVLAKQNESYRQRLSQLRGRQDLAIVAESQAMRRVLHEADMVARSRVPVLIEGATGTGKEVVAEFIHRHSDRAEQMMSVVNCGALSETLMDAELFGNERGAFTGATDARAGLIEVADKGTLFLDEIGDLPASAQVRLLRFLERGVVRRVGSTRERKMDVRILAATHKTLKEQVQAGTFREDLYHRLLVIRIEVPPLRERIEDILPLALRFYELACQEAHLEPLPFSEEVRHALTQHDWPGNVRELAHSVQRAMFAARLDGAEELRPEHFDLPVPGVGNSPLLPIKEVRRRAEEQHVRAALRHFGGNRRMAAKSLGISERHMYRLLA